MSECRGTCTVRIFETRNLRVATTSSGVDEVVARRFLQAAVEKLTAWQKESGCESDTCECVPLADYMPDAKGRRRKEPEWTVFRVRDVFTEAGPDSDPELIIGDVETRSAIVPGLCDRLSLIDVSRRRKTRAPEKKGR